MLLLLDVTIDQISRRRDTNPGSGIRLASLIGPDLVDHANRGGIGRLAPIDILESLFRDCEKVEAS